MKENVTVKQALSKGRIQLVYVPLIVILCLTAGAYYLNSQGITGRWIYPAAIVLSFLISWLVWSYLVVSWKIWAYENVRNVHELKRKAIQQKMIWPDGSWFEKTEIKSDEQKRKLKQLEKKFLQKDVYRDDRSVPKETKIVYSKSKLLFEMILALIVSGVAVFFFTQGKSLLFGCGFAAIGLYMLRSVFKKYQDKQPQITLSESGIRIKQAELIPWDEIWNDRVYTNNSNGKSNETYLAFNNDEILIDDFDIKFEQLEHLLQVYRVRFENNKS